MMLVIGIAVVVALRWYPPWGHSLYPACLFHTLTGLLCPGCGATRAAASLLAGHWAEAARLNVMVLIAAPVAALFAGVQTHSALCWNRWRSIAIPTPLIVCSLVALGLFCLTRNLGRLF